MTMVKIFDTKTEKLKNVISTDSDSVFISIDKKFMLMKFDSRVTRIDFDAVDIISTAHIPLYHVYTTKDIRL